MLNQLIHQHNSQIITSPVYNHFNTIYTMH